MAPSTDGTEAALARVAAHRRMIEAYAFAITRDAHLAEDVFQEVAVVVGERGDAPAPPGFLPWLKEVVRREALELRRRRARVGKPLSDEALANVAAALPDEPPDEAAALAACLARLAGDAREAVLARYRDGLEVGAIAERIGRTVQAAYAVLKRARVAWLVKRGADATPDAAFAIDDVVAFVAAGAVDGATTLVP